MEAQAPSIATTGPDSSSTKAESGLPPALSGPGDNILSNGNKPTVSDEQTAAHTSLNNGDSAVNATAEKVASSSAVEPASTTVEHGGDSIVAPDTVTSSSTAPLPLVSETAPSVGDEAAAMKDVEKPHQVGGVAQPVSNFEPLSAEKPTSPEVEPKAADPVKEDDRITLPAPESAAASSAGVTNGTTTGEGGAAKRKADDLETEGTTTANVGTDDAQQTNRPIKKQKKGGLAGKVASAVDKVKEKITPKKKAPKKERAPVGKTERKTRSQAAA